MNLDRFQNERRPSWDELDHLVAAARRKPERLGPERIRALGSLYRAASADLALARRKWPGDPVVVRLEVLVGAARHLVYDSPIRSRSLADFIVHGYWKRVAERPLPLVIAAVLLIGSGTLSALWARSDPADAATVAPESARAVTREREEGRSLGLSVEEKAAFSSFIFTHNIRVSFLALGGGILLGLGTAYVLLYNGFVLGAVAGLAIGAGNGTPFFELTTGHGILELSCIIVTAAAGLRLGWSLVEPGPGRRIDSLVAEARRATELVLGTVPWLVVAGLVEGFVTPSGLGLSTMIVVGVGLGLIYWALVLWRGHGARVPSG
ncbi:MAG: stage II sporulation protein M [Actinomycetota bacterium]